MDDFAKTMWVVDDDRAVGPMVGAMIERCGWSARVWPDPTAVLAALPAEEPIAALLVAAHLPGIDGATLVHTLRRDLGLSVALILMTGDDRILEDAASWPVDGILKKPFRMAQLRGLLQAVLAATRR